MSQAEVQKKLRLVRSILKKEGLSGIRFIGSDWFSWLTAGGSSVVLLASEVGIAEILVTDTQAWVLCDEIESERLKKEEVSEDFTIWARPWTQPFRTLDFIKDLTQCGKVASDRPIRDEVSFCEELRAAKRQLLPEEIQRYKELSLEASQAMTESLKRADPSWSEFELASEGAKNLWKRGLHPVLILVAGDERSFQYRHPFPTHAKLGRKAMMVFCARKYGLYANLSRIVYFEKPNAKELKSQGALFRIEAKAFHSIQSTQTLAHVYQSLQKAYEKEGFSHEIKRHHQGGLTGYLSREIIATPYSNHSIQLRNAFAWNPSLPGFKIEDTVIFDQDQLEDKIEVMTFDPEWPYQEWFGRKRPDFLIR